jgi:excisionase family DNA binding protein
MTGPAGSDTGRVRDYSPLEVAALTGLSRSLIYREIERGNLAAYRIGTRLRVEPEAVARWKEHCRVRPRWQQPMYEPAPRSRRPRSSIAFADELAAIERGAGGWA